MSFPDFLGVDRTLKRAQEQINPKMMIIKEDEHFGRVSQSEAHAPRSARVDSSAESCSIFNNFQKNSKYVNEQTTAFIDWLNFEQVELFKGVDKKNVNARRGVIFSL